MTALINPQQAIVARYHYDPYGNLLAKSGSLADANLYRFSSKEAHTPSGLVYYLYRYYAPELQRWVNRDRIQEYGGNNLFIFVKSNPIDKIDPKGESVIVVCLIIAGVAVCTSGCGNPPKKPPKILPKWYTQSLQDCKNKKTINRQVNPQGWMDACQNCCFSKCANKTTLVYGIQCLQKCKTDCYSE